VDGKKNSIMGRVRELRLLSATAHSGSLEGGILTLSQVEKLFPLADELGLQPLTVSQTDVVLSIGPLLIEPVHYCPS